MIKLSTLFELIGKVKTNVWQFWRAVFSANHDYPYHDYVSFTNEGQDPVDYIYVVGQNMVDAHGTQRKLFTAKRTLIWSVVPITIRLNSASNVPIRLKLHQLVLEDMIYQMELHTNISMIIFTLDPGGEVFAYFEGVFPDEARNPE